MWSGPRNLSTAMMYSFGNRGDFAVLDEPFYAAYLAMTGADHPMREESIAGGIVEPGQVVENLVGPIPKGRPHFYQKHMIHHMVEGVPRDWIPAVTNVFLIRHPVRVVASYIRKRENPSPRDLGFGLMTELYDQARSGGQDPIVVDGSDIRAAPEGMLRALCAALGLDWDPAMLSWAPGGRPEDGPWAPHWYGAVHRSSGFDAAEADLPHLESGAADLAEMGMEEFDRLSARALRPREES